ncbi:MAG: hypothetical protein ACI9I4_002101 [Neolewinella sp.]|jgi:hypothetical protein
MINLEKSLKPGYLVNRKTLYSYGLTRPDVDYYVRSGFLTSFAHGVYHRKSDYNLTWHEVVASLADLGSEVHVGGISVIREAGLDHFVSVSDTTSSISLFSAEVLPKWLNNKSFAIPFISKKQSWLKKLPDSVHRSQPFGQWERGIKYATLELALLEQLVDAKLESDIVAIDRQLEGMANLSPTRLNELLVLCSNVKAKRLLGWLSNRHEHAWVEHLKWDAVDLGKGKRSIIKGGRYNDQWQITVPRKMENQPVHGH